MPVHLLAIPACKAIIAKVHVLYGKYKVAKLTFDWADAHSELEDLERTYDALKSEPGHADLRTTASGGPAFRKAIRDAKTACESKDEAMFEMALKKVIMPH